MEETNFGEIISEILEDEDYSIALLAHQCGCTTQYLRMLQNGDRRSCGYEIGRRLVAIHKDLYGE